MRYGGVRMEFFHIYMKQIGVKLIVKFFTHY